MSALNNINELVRLYGSKIYTKNTDKISKQIVKSLSDDFPTVDCDELIHIHCKKGGKGKFVLHGFVHDNIFEIVLIDPCHDLHSF